MIPLSSRRHHCYGSVPASLRNDSVVPVTFDSQARTERRREPRLVHSFRVCVTETSNEGVDHVTGRVCNASRSGVCIRVPQPLSLPMCLQCEMLIPESMVTIRTLMQVRWMKVADEFTYEYGLLYLV